MLRQGTCLYSVYLIRLSSCFTRCNSAQFYSRAGQSTKRCKLLTTAPEIAMADWCATVYWFYIQAMPSHSVIWGRLAQVDVPLSPIPAFDGVAGLHNGHLYSNSASANDLEVRLRALTVSRWPKPVEMGIKNLKFLSSLFMNETLISSPCPSFCCVFLYSPFW
jgi:hypothetical protein